MVTCFRSISTTSLEILEASFFNCSILALVSCSSLFTFAPESPLVCFSSQVPVIRNKCSKETRMFKKNQVFRNLTSSSFLWNPCSVLVLCSEISVSASSLACFILAIFAENKNISCLSITGCITKPSISSTLRSNASQTNPLCHQQFHAFTGSSVHKEHCFCLHQHTINIRTCKDE